MEISNLLYLSKQGQKFVLQELIDTLWCDKQSHYNYVNNNIYPIV